MKRFTLALLVSVAMGIPGGALCAAGEKGIVPPPALHVPYGGKILTDVNIADGDVLGVIKEILPTLVDAAKSAFSEAGNTIPQNIPDLMKIDMQPLLDSISGVKNVRVVIVQYPRNTSGEQILKQANAGLAKIGRYNRLMMQSGGEAGSVALYGQEDSAGFAGFAYDSRANTLVAARIVGPIDVVKLLAWASNVGIKVSSQAIPNPTPTEPQK